MMIGSSWLRIQHQVHVEMKGRRFRVKMHGGNNVIVGELLNKYGGIK